MSRYNHFGLQKYIEINFKDLDIAHSFRLTKFDGKRRRKDILMIKTGPLSYMEVKSKKEYTLFSSDLSVRHHSKLIANEPKG